MSFLINNKQSLLERLSEHKNSIKNLGVKNLCLFGSFAKDDAIHPDSDVDLFVEFEHGKKTFDNFMDLSFFLEKILNRKVELVTPQSLSKYSGHHILNELEYVAL